MASTVPLQLWARSILPKQVLRRESERWMVVSAIQNLAVVLTRKHHPFLALVRKWRNQWATAYNLDDERLAPATVWKSSIDFGAK